MFFKPEGEQFWSQRTSEDLRRDWGETEGTWVDGYWNSQNHSHRKLIINALKTFDFNSVLELGCNAGPNLAIIKDNFHKKLAGMDVNPEAIKKAKEMIPEVDLRCDSILNLPLPFGDKSFDIVICDAVLMYVGPDMIKKVLDDINRIAIKGVIFIEWVDRSMIGIIKNYHWARNYNLLLRKRGFKVISHKITKKEWPTSRSWYKNGYLFIGYRQA